MSENWKLGIGVHDSFDREWALQFMRDNWPQGGAGPAVELVKVEKRR